MSWLEERIANIGRWPVLETYEPDGHGFPGDGVGTAFVEFIFQ